MAVDAIQQRPQESQGQGSPGQDGARAHPLPRFDPRRFDTQGDDQGRQHPPSQGHLIRRTQPGPGPMERQEPPEDEQNQPIGGKGLEDKGRPQRRVRHLAKSQAQDEGQRETGQTVGAGATPQGGVDGPGQGGRSNWMSGAHGWRRFGGGGDDEPSDAVKKIPIGLLGILNNNEMARP